MWRWRKWLPVEKKKISWCKRGEEVQRILMYGGIGKWFLLFCCRMWKLIRNINQCKLLMEYIYIYIYIYKHISFSVIVYVCVCVREWVCGRRPVTQCTNKMSRSPYHDIFVLNTRKCVRGFGRRFDWMFKNFRIIWDIHSISEKNYIIL